MTKHTAQERPKTVTYTCVIERDGNVFFAWFPAILGVFSNGTARRETRTNAREALGLYCSTELDYGRTLPADRAPTKRELRNRGARASRVRAVLLPPATPGDRSAGYTEHA